MSRTTMVDATWSTRHIHMYGRLAFVVALSTFSQLRRVTLAYENMKRIVFESTAWRECGAACSDEIHAIKNCSGRGRSDNELLRSEKGPSSRSRPKNLNRKFIISSAALSRKSRGEINFISDGARFSRKLNETKLERWFSRDSFNSCDVRKD